MKEIQTILPYYVYKNLAESKNGFPGDKDFIKLLIPALKELKDEDIIIWIGKIQESQIMPLATVRQKSYNAIEICFIREYVRRVELEKEVERKKQELYAEFESRCMKEDWYIKFSKYDSIQQTLNARVQQLLCFHFKDSTGAYTWNQQFQQHLSHLEAQEIRDKIRTEKWFTGIDPAQIAEEDKYSKYSVSDFQVEIDRHCADSLDAQLNGDKESALLHTKIAECLSIRQQELKNKIQALQSNKYKDQLLGAWVSNNSKPSNAGDITLKGIQDVFNHFSWKFPKGK